jgi:pantoate--beta-alanine ligase
VIVEPTIEGFRAWRRAAPGPVGLVPTMGFLHAGHMSLVERARRENASAAVSIFVNPTQFAATEDLSTYPRDETRDLEMLREAGVDAVFMPAPAEMYPPDFDTWVTPGAVAEPLEGRARPGHFRGVATVVLKLFSVVQPDRAYFGQKDAQQLRVISKMVKDLDVPVEIVGMPIVREPDGLAMSSRNTYLGAEERRAALVLSLSLQHAETLWRDGVTSAEALRAALTTTINAEPLAALDYVSVADPLTLRELDDTGAGALVSLAVRVGKARLIDNALLTPPDGTPPHRTSDGA